LKEGYEITFSGISTGASISQLIFLNLVFNSSFKPKYIQRVKFIGFNTIIYYNQIFKNKINNTIFEIRKYKDIELSSKIINFVIKSSILQNFLPNLVSLKENNGFTKFFDGYLNKEEFEIELDDKVSIDAYPIGNYLILEGSNKKILINECSIDEKLKLFETKNKIEIKSSDYKNVKLNIIK
jgi:hypothetical protein